MLYCLPYDYMPASTCLLFTKYLDRVIPDKESQTVLQELLGSIFIKNINLEKIGILYGSGSNGKSVLLKIITALLGDNNISQMDLKSLTTDNRLSNGAKVIMMYLLNLPNGQIINNADIMEKLNIKQGDTIAKYWKELISNGWVIRQQIKNNKNQFGNFNYTLCKPR